jgi:hypothetical protein
LKQLQREKEEARERGAPESRHGMAGLTLLDSDMIPPWIYMYISFFFLLSRDCMILSAWLAERWFTIGFIIFFYRFRPVSLLAASESKLLITVTTRTAFGSTNHAVLFHSDLDRGRGTVKAESKVDW